jgi:hypothetical protein
MRYNQARAEHESRDTDEPFDMSKVVVPNIPRKPHAILKACREEVRIEIVFLRI